ncbi:hypothetical protein B9T19_07630 [Ignatzschineria sp. F8392]|nr:hypothetical protein B9T19_07630 [Ignatzschineria sp. F8392]
MLDLIKRDIWYLPVTLSRIKPENVPALKHKLIKKICNNNFDWKIPGLLLLQDLVKDINAEKKDINNKLLLGKSIWLTINSTEKIVCSNLNNNLSHQIFTSGHLILFDGEVAKKNLNQLIDQLQKEGYEFSPYNNSGHSIKNVLQIFLENQTKYPCTNLNIIKTYKNLDYNRCRLPIIEKVNFTDPNKGLWEFNGLDQDLLQKEGLIARDPLKDVERWKGRCIGIDFGTSSTVVAYDDINGHHKLLRIGVDDYYEKVLPEHYENPTILEFLDIQKMLEYWQSEAQQPFVSWNEVRCSHEALHNLRNNDSDPQIVASIMTTLKQWALRENNDDPIRIRDQREGFEYRLSHLTQRNPVRGELLKVNEEDPFDPIELYAWFLGLNINWRNRGIFLKYYMTFPVSYPNDVKEKILSSFRRGLMRSLPAALVEHQDVMAEFLVEERGSEPAAYVAAAMPAYNIEPTEEGIPYAVFDFGGGTTDFDFGIYRLSTDEEYDTQAIEEVFEHFEASGDNFLGGENLLENMAYIVFKHNLDLCRSKKISFTKPLDAKTFPGSEMLIDDTQSAHTNTLILISKLRPMWEQNQVSNTGVESITLIDREGERVTCELIIPVEELNQYLIHRIYQGIQSFFVAMKKAFQDKNITKIHLLLAGNSTKSPLVQDLFSVMTGSTDLSAVDNRIQEMEINFEQLQHLLPKNELEFIIHKPLEADQFDEAQPTAKTGVALGILRLSPGSGVKAINHTVTESGGEAPFAYYVGRSRRRKFEVLIERNAPYKEWQELSVVPEGGIFYLYFTQSTLAHGNEMAIGNSELYNLPISFPANCVGEKIYAMPKTPNSICIGCSSQEQDDISEHNLNGLQEVSLLNL